MKHFAHYIRRQITEQPFEQEDIPPKHVKPQRADQGFDTPVFHSTATHSGAASRVSTGDKIWLFSQLHSPWGSLPPSLDGVLSVQEITPHKSEIGHSCFIAGPASKWYPLYDATALIHAMLAVDAAGHVRRLLHTPTTSIGQALRFMREVLEPSQLELHAMKVQATPADFISYRMVDGEKSAFELSKILMLDQRTVFWDRWSLPRRLVERGEQLAPDKLDDRLISAIQDSRVVWGVSSTRYAENGSYSKMEHELALQLGKFHPYPYLKG